MMFNQAMMDPELMRIAQEQMSRIPPEELAKIQQQMMSNPELIKLATESMKNMRPEDMRSAAEQLKQTRIEDMVEIGEKMAKATPEEIAAMHAHADSQISYKLSASEMLKKQGNKLHNSGNYHDAAEKYNLAKNNLKDIPDFRCRTLRSQCSVNLMSCYLKLGQFKKCIKEGSDVLSYDSTNVKALYRRGQASKEIGDLEAAISDLDKAHEMSPDDETISDVLRAVNEKVKEKAADRTVSGGVVIEELVEADDDKEEPKIFKGSSSSSAQKEVTSDINSTADLQANPEAVKSFQSFVSTADPASLASMGGGQISPEMIKVASEMISKMKPDELQAMLQTAAVVNGGRTAPTFPQLSPEMAQMASERISKMSPDELQKMVEATSSMNPAFSSHSSRTRGKSHPSTSARPASSVEEGPSSGPSLSPSMADIQDNLKDMSKDPATRQMMAAMMKNMNPEMMVCMSEQFGMKLTKEDVAKAQQAMSSLSPDDIDRMMKWAERVQKGVETAKKTKNWLMGPKGLILAFCILILAFVFHQLGFIGA
ncbi:tetratricopeptide repeat (TPR)-like superfamily protein [Wolffia australiana]